MSTGTCTNSRKIITASVVCLLTLFGMPVRQESAALEIRLNYDARQSQPPSFDPDGSRLGTMMREAADAWEDIIEDSGTLNLAYTWGDLAGEARGISVTLNTRFGKPTDGRIRFDTQNNGSELNWFIDPTPRDPSEFDLPRILYEDLTSQQQNDWFGGTPPDVFEVSKAGIARRDAPFAARTGLDLYSIALHEIGHILGLNGGNTRQTSDLDFDVDPLLVGDARMAIAVSQENDRAHLAAERTLMFPVVVEGIRRLPSQTDVLAIASAAGWTSIDLPRQDFLNGLNWNQPRNWIGNSVPDANDDAYVRHAGNVSVRNRAEVENLAIANASLLRTEATELMVHDSLIIEGSGRSPSTRLAVESDGRVHAGQLSIFRGGRLDLNHGIAQVKTTLTLDSTSDLWGFGSVNVGTLINDGAIVADGGTLRLVATSGIDLDGDGNRGTLTARNGDLVISGPGLDQAIQFRGGIEVGRGRRLQLEGVRLEIGAGSSPGELHLSGGAISSAELVQGGQLTTSGAPVSIEGNARFLQTSSNRLESDLHLTGATSVSRGAQFSGNAQLIIDPGASLNLQSGAIVGVGLLNQGEWRFEEVGASSARVDSFQQSESATLVLHVDGSTSHDVLKVDSSAHLDGKLEIIQTRVIRPSVDQTSVFSILTASQTTGTFDTLPARHRGGGVFLDVVYASGAVNLEFHRASAGDANGDRLFDQRDIIRVLSGAKYLTGQPAEWTEGDWGGDGLFDQRDLIAALATRRFQASSLRASRLETVELNEIQRHVHSIPEPASIWILAAGLVFSIKCLYERSFVGTDQCHPRRARPS